MPTWTKNEQKAGLGFAERRFSKMLESSVSLSDAKLLVNDILRLVDESCMTGVSWELLSFSEDKLVGCLKEKKEEALKPVNDNPVNGKKVLQLPLLQFMVSAHLNRS